MKLKKLTKKENLLISIKDIRKNYQDCYPTVISKRGLDFIEELCDVFKQEVEEIFVKRGKK